ncbi:MAG: tripartite tricarboxylate transporter TctB family protein [Hyphomicrobiales bacterium]|nr:tripartite tricarboxylate transporter TctB family protein [Hyphomicrobiales bacterium]
MLLSKDRVGGAVLLIFCIVYALMSQEIRLLPFQANAAFTARTMPEVLSVLGIALSLWIILIPSNHNKPVFVGYQWVPTILFLISMSLYGLTIRYFGFIVSTSAFLMFGFFLLGERKPLTLLLAAVPLVVLFWFLMSKGLNIYLAPLPEFFGLGR